MVLHHCDDLGDSVFLPGDRDDSRAAARRVLGPALEYDETHAAHLMDSLRVFFEEKAVLATSAQRLHIHKETLIYRLRRVEALTGRDQSGDPQARPWNAQARSGVWPGVFTTTSPNAAPGSSASTAA